MCTKKRKLENMSKHKTAFDITEIIIKKKIKSLTKTVEDKKEVYSYQKILKSAKFYKY